MNENGIVIANIRAKLGNLEADVEAALRPILEGKSVLFSGELTIAEIQRELREAIALGHGGTFLIQNLCEKYGVEIPKEEAEEEVAST